MDNKLMYNPNYDKLNYHFIRLQLLIGKLGHQTLWFNKSTQTLKTNDFKPSSTNVIYSPMSPPSLQKLSKLCQEKNPLGFLKLSIKYFLIFTFTILFSIWKGYL